MGTRGSGLRTRAVALLGDKIPCAGRGGPWPDRQRGRDQSAATGFLQPLLVATATGWAGRLEQNGRKRRGPRRHPGLALRPGRPFGAHFISGPAATPFSLPRLLIMGPGRQKGQQHTAPRSTDQAQSQAEGRWRGETVQPPQSPHIAPWLAPPRPALPLPLQLPLQLPGLPVQGAPEAG